MPGVSCIGPSPGRVLEIVDGIYLGVADAEIVGIQYYTGSLSDRALVEFKRAPANPYDKNAVEVHNLFEELIGYLPRKAVMHLALLLDRGDLAIVGLAPRGSKNHVYSIPLKLFVYAQPGQDDDIRSAFKNAGLDLHCDPAAERMLEAEVNDLLS